MSIFELISSGFKICDEISEEIYVLKNNKNKVIDFIEKNKENDNLINLFQTEFFGNIEYSKSKGDKNTQKITNNILNSFQSINDDIEYVDFLQLDNIIGHDFVYYFNLSNLICFIDDEARYRVIGYDWEDYEYIEEKEEEIQNEKELLIELAKSTINQLNNYLDNVKIYVSFDENKNDELHIQKSLKLKHYNLIDNLQDSTNNYNENDAYYYISNMIYKPENYDTFLKEWEQKVITFKMELTQLKDEFSVLNQYIKEDIRKMEEFFYDYNNLIEGR